MNELVMVVDDNKEIRDIVRLYLTNSGFEVIEARNGVEAIELLDKNSVDLIILDIMMPEMDGIEVLKKIGQDRDFPIIFLSA